MAERSQVSEEQAADGKLDRELVIELDAILARADWERAAELWAQHQRTGRPIADADLLIAVQAKRLGTILVTDNEKNFEGLGLRIENWRRR